jgi:hypothetical protein
MLHHQAPAIRGVTRMRVEPDTPGRRLAYGRRMRLIEQYSAAFDQLIGDARAGRYDRPLMLQAMQEVG